MLRWELKIEDSLAGYNSRTAKKWKANGDYDAAALRRKDLDATETFICRDIPSDLVEKAKPYVENRYLNSR